MNMQDQRSSKPHWVVSGASEAELAALSESISATGGKLRALVHDIDRASESLAGAEPLDSGLGEDSLLPLLVEPVPDVLLFSTSRAHAEPTDLLRAHIRRPQRLLHSLVPLMVARGNGTIVFSVAAEVLAPRPGAAPRSAAGGWISSFAAALSVELTGTGVDVGIVCGAQPEQLHASILEALAKDSRLLIVDGTIKKRWQSAALLPRRTWSTRMFPGVRS